MPWRIIGVATGLQLGLTAGLLLTSLRVHIFGVVGNLTSLLQTTSQKAGQSLLFIGVSNPEFTSTYGPIIALEIAAIIIFVANDTVLLIAVAVFVTGSHIIIHINRLIAVINISFQTHFCSWLGASV